MDIVERLYELSRHMLRLNMDMSLPEGSIDPSEAADLITNLRARCASLEADCKREAELASHMARDCADEQNRRERAEADRDALQQQVWALDAKVRSLSAHETCGCSYDSIDDLCPHHSPKLARSESMCADLAKALEPFAAIGDGGRGSALQDDNPLAVVNANMPDLPTWLAKVKGVVTQKRENERVEQEEAR